MCIPLPSPTSNGQERKRENQPTWHIDRWMEWMSDILLNRQKDREATVWSYRRLNFFIMVLITHTKGPRKLKSKMATFQERIFLIHSMKCLKWELTETSLNHSLSICQQMKAPVPLYNWMTHCHELPFTNGSEGQDTWAPFTKCKLAQRCLMFCHEAENKKVLDIPAFPPQNTSKLRAVKQ